MYILHNKKILSICIIVLLGIAMYPIYRSRANTLSVSNCGTGATIEGTDMAAKIILGSGSISSCTINFTESWNHSCVVNINSTSPANDILTVSIENGDVSDFKMVVTTNGQFDGDALMMLL